MPTGFERIIALIRRTGDRCVVLDAAGNPAYVIVPFQEYERMASPMPGRAGNPAGLLDSITQAAAGRQSAATESWEAGAAEAPPPSVGSAEAGGATADQYYFEPIE